MARATPATDGYEYYEHRDGDYYRIRAGMVGLWQTTLDLADPEDEWMTIHVALSDQDLDHIYPLDPADVEAARA